MRAVILTHYFWPEAADFKNMALAKALVERGHEVTVIAPYPNYPTGRVFDGYKMRWRTWEHKDGVRLLRLPLIPSHSSSGLGRMANYVSFMVAAATLGAALVGRTELVFVYSPPMTMGVPAWVLKRVRGAKVLLDVVDIWPDAVVSSGMSKSRVAPAVAGLLARQAYRSADSITVLTEGFKRRVRESGARANTPIEVRWPWAPEGGLAPAPRDEEFGRSHGLDNCFCVIHAGNLGAVQDTDNLMAAAALLQVEAPDVRLVLVGGGTNLERVKAQVAAEGLGNVVVAGLFPREAVPGILAWADACLVSLARDPYLSMNIPSKLPAYMGAGRPIIVAASGDLASLVESTGIGIACEPGNPRALASAIEQLRGMDIAAREAMGRASRATLDQFFTYEEGLQQALADCESLASGNDAKVRDFGHGLGVQR